MKDPSNNERCFELLVYLVSSAAGLKKEPHIYGSLRLIEASRQLGQILADSDETKRAAFTELIDTIERAKNKCMTDQDAFYEMLDEASLKLVDCC